jgi:hypothetical protein
MQYLSARQEIIKYLYSEKRRTSKEPADSGDGSAFKDTVILENTVFEPVAKSDTGPNEKFERLPKGEAVTIIMKPGEEADVLLSRHECKIISKDNKIFFVDNEERSYELQDGRSVVGRDSVSTVMMEPNLRDISRMHIVIQKFDESTIQVTDLSSHGTYIQAKYLESHTGG